MLGHEKVTHYADNKPTARRVLKLLVRARNSFGQDPYARHQALGLSRECISGERRPAHSRSCSQFDGRDCGADWTSIQRTTPIVEQLALQACGVGVEPFPGRAGRYKLYGRPSEGKVCRYGEVVFAYVPAKAGYKADPRKSAFALGKVRPWTAGSLEMVCSIRRVDQSWKRYLSCFKSFSAYSWEYYQTNFGG